MSSAGARGHKCPGQEKRHQSGQPICAEVSEPENQRFEQSIEGKGAGLTSLGEASQCLGWLIEPLTILRLKLREPPGHQPIDGLSATRCDLEGGWRCFIAWLWRERQGIRAANAPR
jgi:hypothetical protein